MEATYSFETSIHFKRYTRFYFPEDRTLREISILSLSQSEGWNPEPRITVLARTITNLAVSQFDLVEIDLTGETFSVVQNPAINNGSSDSTLFCF
jgi:hypothetical protein